MKKLILVVSCMAGLLFAGVAQAGIFGGSGGEQQTSGQESSQDQGLFQKIDENQDGQISQQEFEAYEFKDQEKSKLFSTIDENQDGQITQEELTTYESTSGGLSDGASGSQQEMGAASGQADFSMIDKDADGQVTQSEFDEYKAQDPSMTQDFSTLDADQDGSVTQQEWQEKMQSGGASQ